MRSGFGAAAAALALALLLPGTSEASGPPQPTMSLTVHTTPDVDHLEGRAQRLRSELEELKARAAWAEERLAQAREELARATTSALTAEEQLAALNGASGQAAADIAHRVRAIEQSGGAAALFSRAVDAAELTDVASNVAALHAVLATDVVRAADAEEAQQQMLDVHRRLDAIADRRAWLVDRVQLLDGRAQTLVRAQRALVKRADGQVRRALRAIEREQSTSSVTTWTGPIPAGATPYAGAAVAAALSVLGSPYVWGDEGPTTFDCSGLIQWSYLQAGLVLPRVASDQYAASTPVPVDQMQPGDVIAYAYDVGNPRTVYHITMYIGDGLMVHAPRTGDVVKVVPVDADSMIGAARPGV